MNRRTIFIFITVVIAACVAAVLSACNFLGNSVCGSSHEFGEITEIKAPTCTTTGVDAKKCLYCPRKTTEITPVNPLKHERGAVVYGERNAENCTVRATVSCTLCGKEIDGWNEPRHDYEEETFVCTGKGCNSVKEIPSSYFTYSLSTMSITAKMNFAVSIKRE